VKRVFLCAVGLSAAAALSTVTAGAASAAPAALPSNCTESGLTVTCAYGYTGAEQTFVVPAGVTAVQATAIGAAGGGSSFLDLIAGSGGIASAAVPVTATETLYVEVERGAGRRRGQ
jgi:hypothetical protein